MTENSVVVMFMIVV